VLSVAGWLRLGVSNRPFVTTALLDLRRMMAPVFKPEPNYPRGFGVNKQIFGAK